MAGHQGAAVRCSIPHLLSRGPPGRGVSEMGVFQTRRGKLTWGARLYLSRLGGFFPQPCGKGSVPVYYG